MTNKLFVGSLSFKTNSDGLAAHFAPYGNVISANVLMDKMTGRSKGYGFVEMASEEEAKLALAATNSTELDGRPIFVDLVLPKSAIEYKRPEANSSEDNANQASPMQGTDINTDTPRNLLLIFDTAEYDSHEISEVLLLLSEVYNSIGGDELQINYMESFEFIEELEPQTS